MYIDGSLRGQLSTARPVAASDLALCGARRPPYHSCSNTTPRAARPPRSCVAVAASLVTATMPWWSSMPGPVTLELREPAREQIETAEPPYLTALRVAELLQVDEKRETSS